ALHVGTVVAGKRGPHAECHEVAAGDPQRGDKPRKDGEGGGKKVGVSTADATHQPGTGQGRKREAKVVETDRQRGHRGVVGQHLPHDTAQRDDDGRRSAAQCLGGHQHANVAVGGGAAVGCKGGGG